MGDLPFPFFQHFDNRLISESLQKNTNNTEADNLSEQVRPVHPEGLGDLFDLPAARYHQCHTMHKHALSSPGAEPFLIRPNFFLLNQKECVEHDRFCEGNG